MKSLLLILGVVLVVIYGYYLMGRLDHFLEENVCSNQFEEEEHL